MFGYVIARKETLSEEQIAQYDVDANGKLDYKDAMQILRKSIGL